MVTLVDTCGLALLFWLLLHGVDLRLNQTMSIAFGVFGIVALLAYMMSRAYLLTEIIFVIPYMDPVDCRVRSFLSYWPHFA